MKGAYFKMNTIRNEKLTVSDQTQVETFITKARIGHLGVTDGDFPYVVPLNYAYYNDQLYFHGANEGKKVRIIKENNHACFSICDEYGTMVDPVPAKTDTAYMSVMIFGEIEEVTDLDEATQAMQMMVDKYVPGYYERAVRKSHVQNYRSSLGASTAVYRIDPQTITAKANPLDEAIAFFPGRRVHKDETTE